VSALAVRHPCAPGAHRFDAGRCIHCHALDPEADRPRPKPVELEAPVHTRRALGKGLDALLRPMVAGANGDGGRDAPFGADSMADPFTDPAAEPLSLADRARRMFAAPVVRMATGLPTLDTACRGGLGVPRLVVVGGAPGAGKTSLCVWLGWQWARGGATVGMLAIDEGPEGIVKRVSQLEGLDLGKLEGADEAERETLAGRLDALPMLAGDESETIEQFCSRLREYASRRQGLAQPGVLIVDSAQTARVERGEYAADVRTRVGLVVQAAKRAAHTHGWLVLLTSELARAAYRSQASADETNPLAAFKESGAVEYGAETALVLRNVAGGDGAIDVTVAKNRGYLKEAFRLEMDRQSTAFREVELPAAGARSRKPAASVEDDGAEVRRALLERPGIAGTAKLRAALRARETGGQGMGNARVDTALAWLERRGELVNRGTVNRPKFYVQAPNTGAEREP
jgi:KaiC/GvpD/RAD55 family RecA-like ATPase